VTDTVTSVIDTFSDNNKDKLAYILGALYGDGHFNLNSHRIQFGSCDIEFIRCLVNYISDIFNIKLNISVIKLSKKNKNHRDYYYISSSRKLYDMISQFNYKYLKRIPDFITNGRMSIRAAFLGGVFDAEGNVDIHIIKSRNEIQRHVRCYSNDKNFLEKIKILLLNLEIKSCINRSKGKNYCLTIWNHKGLVNFEKYVNFNIIRKKLELRKAIESYKQIQTQWNKETYNAVINLRNCGFGATNIQKKLLIKIPKPTIESWIYKDVKITR